MNRFFNRKPEDSETRLKVIRHLASQTSLQQLSMEIYNDGMARASDSSFDRGDEINRRAGGGSFLPSNVELHFIPAAEQKVRLAAEMVSEHEAFDIATLPKRELEACRVWSNFLQVFMARARLQLSCLQEVVEMPSIDVNTRMISLDAAEIAAMRKGLAAQNGLVKKAGLVGEPWDEITIESINLVRERIELAPLTRNEFTTRLHQGLTGGNARYFN